MKNSKYPSKVSILRILFFFFKKKKKNRLKNYICENDMSLHHIYGQCTGNLTVVCLYEMVDYQKNGLFHYVFQSDTPSKTQH